MSSCTRLWAEAGSRNPISDASLILIEVLLEANEDLPNVLR
jgi:hypothetical protein